MRLFFSSIVSLGLATTAMASPIFFQQNFDTLNLATINGQAGWTGSANSVVQNVTANPIRALKMNTGGSSSRTGIFDSAANNPLQRLQFDMLIPFTINQVPFANSADIQHAITLFGPSVNQNLFIVYKGAKNPNQAVQSPPSGVNSISFRGSSGTQDSTFSPQPNVWYTVVLDFNFATSKFDGQIFQGSTLLWDPVGNRNFFANGNANNFVPQADNVFDGTYASIGDVADLALVIDNVVVFVPEPATLGLIPLAGAILARRRK